MKKKVVSLALTGIMSITMAASAFAYPESNNRFVTESGQRTGSIHGDHQYGRMTLKLDTIVWYDNYAYASLYEVCPGKPRNNLGTVTVGMYNREASNNFYMSGACTYYAEYTKVSPEGAAVFSNLRIQNFP
ncbi:hypothetical protein [Paenibacillus lutrae]|uniref:Uncharacterized protein n=1 Tax=Paenibacillus lutrae TaxID=2078573 RepID=A0A7X3FFW3_9BACL|nr:hypothetical protein [Paenibacillus lutrae]MVO98932.1 hypothetical protein [Paenibacillus lutrae]